MPKAWPVEELAPDQPLAHAAAAILRVKLPEVLSYQAAARQGKVEGIHDMRVAAKRLREALRVLKPTLPEAARKRLLRQVERLNDALGLVRDRDVLGAAYATICKREPLAAALEGLLTDLAHEREAYHQDLLKLLRRLEQRHFATFYDEAMMTMVATPAAGQPTIMTFAHEAIETRLREVLESWEAASRPEESEAFHRQRIRVKKLKYAIEPFVTLLPPELAPIYEQIAELQELMGLVHDCDVQQQVLDLWIGQHGTATVYRAAAQRITVQRQKALDKLANLLAEMEQNQWADQLRELLERAIILPAQTD